jgi:hypothetical protein
MKDQTNINGWKIFVSQLHHTHSERHNLSSKAQRIYMFNVYINAL